MAAGEENQFHPSGWGNSPQTNRKQIIGALQQRIVDYGMQCREVVLSELAAARMENQELRDCVEELENRLRNIGPAGRLR